jgi:hypothetical protein
MIDIHSLDSRDRLQERDSNWHQNSLFEQSFFSALLFYPSS